MTEVVDQQVEVELTTVLQDSKFHIQDGQRFLMVPTSIQRFGLSKLLNSVLELREARPFEFLIDNKFIRSSLQSYLESTGLTSERSILLEYTLARPKPSSLTLDTTIPDWISCIRVDNPSTICVGSFDGTIGLYDETQRLSTIQAASVGVTGVALCKTPIQQYRTCEEDVVEAIATTKNGLVVFSLLSKEGGSALVTGEGHRDSAECVCVSTDGALAASGGWDSRILLWNNVDILSDETLTQDGSENNSKRKRGDIKLTPRLELTGHGSCLTDVAFPATRLKYTLFSCSMDQTVRAWDVIAGAPLTNWNATRAVTALDVSPAGEQVCTAHDDGRIRIWDIREGATPNLHKVVSGITKNSRLQLSHAYNIHKRIACSVRWNQVNPTLVASVGHDGVLQLMDIRALKLPMQTVTVQPESLEAETKLLCCDWVDVSRVVTGGEDSTLRVHTM